MGKIVDFNLHPQSIKIDGHICNTYMDFNDAMDNYYGTSKLPMVNGRGNDRKNAVMDMYNFVIEKYKPTEYDPKIYTTNEERINKDYFWFYEYVCDLLGVTPQQRHDLFLRRDKLQAKALRNTMLQTIRYADNYLYFHYENVVFEINGGPFDDKASYFIYLKDRYNEDGKKQLYYSGSGRSINDIRRKMLEDCESFFISIKLKGLKIKSDYLPTIPEIIEMTSNIPEATMVEYLSKVIICMSKRYDLEWINDTRNLKHDLPF